MNIIKIIILTLLGILGYFVVYSQSYPLWISMWAISFSLFYLFKFVFLHNAFKNGVFPQLGNLLIYLFLWPGMNIKPFLKNDLNNEKIEFYDLVLPFFNIILGISLIILVFRFTEINSELLKAWLGFAAFIVFLHFGLFTFVTRLLNMFGFNLKPTMSFPLRSKTLSEFWGRRWNTAFSDFSFRFVFRPLVKKIGAKSALVVGFIFSGLVHELVISVPAGGGYGLPTTYFAVQGFGIVFERSAYGEKLGLRNRFIGKMFLIFLTVLFVPLVFHNEFMIKVINPFLKTLVNI